MPSAHTRQAAAELQAGGSWSLASPASTAGPSLARGMARVADGGIRGGGWRLASRNIARNSRRSAATAPALTIGLTVVSAVAATLLRTRDEWTSSSGPPLGARIGGRTAVLAGTDNTGRDQVLDLDMQTGTVGSLGAGRILAARRQCGASRTTVKVRVNRRRFFQFRPVMVTRTVRPSSRISTRPNWPPPGITGPL